jgi:hypothetical protein
MLFCNNLECLLCNKLECLLLLVTSSMAKIFKQFLAVSVVTDNDKRCSLF